MASIFSVAICSSIQKWAGMFEQAFKNVEDVLCIEAGCTTELDYTEQTSWLLFFEKGTRTRKVWYYQLDPGRSLGKTNPLCDDDLAEFVKLQASRASADEGPETKKSWNVDIGSLSNAEADLSVKNPNGGEQVVHRNPQEIMDEIAALDAESSQVLETIRGLL